MSRIKRRPLFLFLLPFFFVLHGFAGHYDFVPVSDALLLVLLYISVSLFIATLFWWLYRDFTKAALIAFLFMCFHFFFGGLQDLLKKYLDGSLFSRYSFILPFSFIVFLAVIIGMKRRKKPLGRLVYYLNCLLMVLLIIDAGWLCSKMLRPHTNSYSGASRGLTICDTCKKPDIYFIILDEYSGNKALKEQFDFDNAPFQNALTQKGFHIVTNSSSNYNYTPYSIASLLNMDYLNLDMKTKNPGNLNYSYGMIRDNNLLQYLTASGYTFYNYSIFDFKGQPARNSDNFLPTKSQLITSQTFVSRIWTDLSADMIMGKHQFRPLEKKLIYSHLHNNEDFLQLTKDIVAKRSPSPKFVYTHLIMPHYPYYFDSKGNALPFDSLIRGRLPEKQFYVEYLQYCNRKILQLADDIIGKSAQPPVIIFAGDHGARYFIQKQLRQYCFMNLLAIYLPDHTTTAFYDNMSNVNLFRILLNTQFHQTIPVLKDSTVYLWD